MEDIVEEVPDKENEIGISTGSEDSEYEEKDEEETDEKIKRKII